MDKDKYKPKRGLVPAIKSFFFGDLINPSEYRGELYSQNFYQILTGSHSFNTRALKYLVDTGYKRNSIGFGIITKIVLAQRNLKFVPYWKGEPYKSKTIDFDLNYALFNLITAGYAVIRKRNIVGYGTSHETLDSLRLTETVRRGIFTYEYQLNEVDRIKIPEEDLLIIPWHPIDTLCTKFGVSPLQAAIMPIESLENMWSYETGLTKNKGVDALISADSNGVPLIGEENETIDETLNKRIAGARKAGRVAVTGASVKVTNLGRTIKELAVWDGYKIKQRDLCTALQVESGLFNDPDNKSYSNRQEAIRSLYNECVVPLTKLITERQEFIDFVGYEVFIDTSDVEALQYTQQIKIDKAKTLTDQILRINQQIQQGIINKEIGILLLVEFGFDQKEAESYINNQNLQNTV